MQNKTMVEVTRDEHILTIMFSSNEFNSVTVALCEEIQSEVDKAREDSTIKVVILTSKGNFFSNGFEPTGFVGKSDAEIAALLAAGFRLAYAFYALPQVTIAAMNGHSMGLGAIWAVFMNYRIAVEKMRFGFPEAQIALAIPAAPAYLVQKMIGTVKARDLAFLGVGLKSAEAAQLGLIDEVVPESDLMIVAKRIAKKFKTIPQDVTAANQRSTKASDLAYVKELVEKDIEMGVHMVKSPNGQEGLKSILEKRRPVFK